MRKQILILLFSILFLTSAAYPVDDLIIKKLCGPTSFTSNSLFSNCIEYMDNGVSKVMAVWAEEGSHLNQIYYSTKENKPGSAWSAPLPATKTGAVSKSPHLVVDLDGVVHLVSADGGSRATKEIYHRVYKDKKWGGGETLITHVGNDSFPRIDVLASGLVDVAWETEAPPFDNSSLVMVNTWSVAGTTNQWDPKGHGISVNANDHNYGTHGDLDSRGLKSYCVWQEGTHQLMHIMFAEKLMKEGEDDHWSWPEQVSLGGGLHTWPKVAVDSLSNVHVIWATTTGKYFYRSRIFGVWGDIKVVNDGSALRDIPEIDVDTNDTLHAIYRGDGIDAYYNVKSAYNLGEWANDIKLTTADKVDLPSVTAGSNGYVHFTWGDLPPGASHSHDIWYGTMPGRQDPATGYPTAAFTMSSQTVTQGMAVTFDGTSSTSPGTISAYHWNFGDPFNATNQQQGQSVTHTFSAEGDYTVTLAVLDRSINRIGVKKVVVSVVNRPAAPTGVTITTVYNRGFITHEWRKTIAWQNNSQNDAIGTLEYFTIHRREKGGAWSELGTVSASPFTYVDTFKSAVESNKYEYGVSVKLAGLDMESDITLASTGTSDSDYNNLKTGRIKKENDKGIK